jgi:serine/threonine-protein kinase
MAFVAIEQGRLERAAELELRAVAIVEENLGPEHPMSGDKEGNLAFVRWKQRRMEEALAGIQRALRSGERVFGDQHLWLVNKLTVLARVLMDTARLDDARATLDRAFKILDASGDRGSERGEIENLLGRLLGLRGAHAEAALHHEKALAIYEGTLGPEHPFVARTRLQLGEALQKNGRSPQATVELTRGISLLEKRIAGGDADMMEGLVRLAEIQSGLGKRDEALALLEKALRIAEAPPMDSPYRARAEFALGSALVEARVDLDRGRDLVLAARGAFHADDRYASELAAVDRWLAAHP